MEKLRAIVIDDLDFCREFLADFMEERGYQTLTFPDVTFCPQYSACAPRCAKPAACADILLLDNRMSPMTGLDFLERHLRDSCHLKPSGKAMFSASWSPAELNRAEQLECKSFHKPYDLKELSEWLNEQEGLIRPDRVLANLNDVTGG